MKHTDSLQKLFRNFLMKELKLDERQYAAVLGDEKKDKTAYRLLVTAPAGSGKTRILASRYLKLLIDGEKPENIVAITFTRKAAGEMKKRVVEYLLMFRKEIEENKLTDDISRCLTNRDMFNRIIIAMRISTIDSFLSSIILLFPGESGVDPNFTVMDEIEEDELIDRVIDELVEERLDKDTSLIDLLQFFNFIYSSTEPSRSTFLYSIKNIVKHWEIYGTTITKLSTMTMQQITDETIRFIGNSMKTRTTLEKLKNRSAEFEKLQRADDALMDTFLLFIIRNSVDDIFNKREDFMYYHLLFLTQKGKPRKKCPFRITDPSVREQYGEIVQLYADCFNGFLLGIDIDNTQLTKGFISFVLDVIQIIQSKKRERGILGIGDLKTISYALLTRHTERFNILFNMDARINHYLIDEFQDVDPIQWEIFQKLTEDWFSGETAKSERRIVPTIFLVGDEKQSIYGFRNADVSIINNIKESDEYFTEKFSLIINYRSKKEIIDSVNTLFENAMKRIETRPTSVGYERMKSHDITGGGTIKFIELDLDGKTEKLAPQLAEKVAQLILSVRNHYANWGDIALLFTNSLHFHYYEKVFEAQSIPYVSSGGTFFFDNAEIRELLKILEFLENPYNDISCAALFLSPLFGYELSDLLELALFSPSIQSGSIEFSLYDTLQLFFSTKYNRFLNLTQNWIDERDRIPIVQLLDKAILDTNAYGILVDSKGGQKDVNIKKLLTLVENISQQTTNYAFFYDRLNRVIQTREKNADIDIGIGSFTEEEKSSIHLMTVHKAKGLEFPVIILPEVDGGTMKISSAGIEIDRYSPYLFFLKKYRNINTPLIHKYREIKRGREEEELKRLLYVALTRAKNELYLFSTKSRVTDTQIWLKIIHAAHFPKTSSLKLTIEPRKEVIAVPEKVKAIYQFTEKSTFSPPKTEISPSKRGKEIARFTLENERAKLKGTILHKLFELIGEKHLLSFDAEYISQTVDIISLQMDSLFLYDEAMEKAIKSEFSKVLHDKNIMLIMANEHSFNEFYYSFEIKDEDAKFITVSGIMDKVIFKNGNILIYDYKTDSINETSRKSFIENMKKQYKHQMEAYRSAAIHLFNKKKEDISTFLILTSILEVVEV